MKSISNSSRPNRTADIGTFGCQPRRVGNLAMVKVLAPNWDRLQRQIMRKHEPEPVKQPSVAEQIHQERLKRRTQRPRSGSWVTKW